MYSQLAGEPGRPARVYSQLGGDRAGHQLGRGQGRAGERAGAQAGGQGRAGGKSSSFLSSRIYQVLILCQSFCHMAKWPGLSTQYILSNDFVLWGISICIRVETIVLLGKQIISDVWKSLAVVTDRFSKDIPFPMSIIYGRLRRFCYKLSSPSI